MTDGATTAARTVSIVEDAVGTGDDRVGHVSPDLLVGSGPAASSMSTPPRGILGVLRNPLLRNGYLLAFNSGSTAVVGLLFWTVAAWKYDPVVVGCTTAAIALMKMASEVSQLELGSAMVRFVPSAGQQARRLVAGAHLVCGCLALLVGAGCVVAVPIISPGSKFLHGLLPAAMFVVAIAVYPLSMIQDGVLVGLRRAALVPVKNLAFAVLKLALVVMLAGVMPTLGIFAAWVLASGAVDTVVGVYLFGWATRGHQRRERGAPAETLPPVSQIARFVAADYGGAVCHITAANVLPIMVLTIFGAEQAAYFNIALMIAYFLQLININMGTSLVAETARDPARLAHAVRHVFAHTAKLQVPVVTLMVLVAPALLGVFGADYRSATGTLRLLALAALPHLLVMVAISSARVQRRLRLLVSVQAAMGALVLPLAWLLMHVVGPSGLGWAVLITQCLLAGLLLMRRDLWLSVDSHAITSPARARNGVALHPPVPIIGLRLFSALRVRRFADQAAAWVRTRQRPWPGGERR
jgi:O-antigen/teichoic acid export membrane protein